MFYSNKITSRSERESRKRVIQYRKWVELCLVPSRVKDTRIKTTNKRLMEKSILYKRELGPLPSGHASFLQFTQQFCYFLIFGGVSYITVRVRLEGSTINHVLITNQLIFLDLAGFFDSVPFGVTIDVVGLGDVGLARPLYQGILNVVQDVLAQNLLIHLTGSFSVEGQTALKIACA